MAEVEPSSQPMSASVLVREDERYFSRRLTSGSTCNCIDSNGKEEIPVVDTRWRLLNRPPVFGEGGVGKSRHGENTTLNGMDED